MPLRQKCAIVERYIRTLKSRIWRYFTQKKTLRYVDVLQKMVTATNHSFHRTIGCTPASVTRENQGKIWQRLYGSDDKRFARALFKPGDHVRITKEKHQLSKGYQPNFTHEVFVVTQILPNRYPPTYKLCDLSGEVLDGIFYNEELVRVALRADVSDVERIIKSELRDDGSLWHLVTNGKKRWMKDEEFLK